MSTVSDLLAIARAPVPTEPAARRAALAETESALGRLDCARDQIAASLTQGTAQRRTLLLAEGAEAERKVAGLDRSLDAMRADAERLELVEEQLIARCRQLDVEHRTDTTAAIAAAYSAAVDQWQTAMLAAGEAREAIVAVRDAAVRAGHERDLGSMDVPHPQFPSETAAVLRFADGVKASIAAVRAGPPKPALSALRFLVPYHVYRSGEVAGFDAATAWQLVDADIAVWADPRRRPPRPAVKGHS